MSAGFLFRTAFKGPKQNNMGIETLDVKIRLAIHPPKISDPGTVIFAEKASESFWLIKKTAPNRAAGAIAPHAKRKQNGESHKAQVAAAKKARIDGSVNQELADDHSEELTGRMGFSSKTHVTKNPQPTEITTELKGGGIYDLHLSIGSCGLKGEWLIAQAKSPPRRSRHKPRN